MNVFIFGKAFLSNCRVQESKLTAILYYRCLICTNALLILLPDIDSYMPVERGFETSKIKRNIAAASLVFSQLLCCRVINSQTTQTDTPTNCLDKTNFLFENRIAHCEVPNGKTRFFIYNIDRESIDFSGTYEELSELGDEKLEIILNAGNKTFGCNILKKLHVIDRLTGELLFSWAITSSQDPSIVSRESYVNYKRIFSDELMKYQGVNIKNEYVLLSKKEKQIGYSGC